MPNTSLLSRLLVSLRRIQVVPTSRPDIDLMQLHNARLVPKFPAEVEEDEDWQ